MLKERCYLTMPVYQGLIPEAARTFWRATRAPELIESATSVGSLLTSCFNQLWCGALNFVHAGGQLSYFAMVHPDVGLELYWLDKLVDELEEQQLDALCVVAPIKDHRGLSSVALASEDPFRVQCRLTMTDVHQLPPTFTSADLGGQPLLLNTGALLLKFNMSWAKKVWFQTLDRIVFDKVAGRYRPQTESEDWFFSRELLAHGLKLGATRKLGLVHAGDARFTNLDPWGTEKFDSEGLDHSPVPGAFPWDVDGWLSPLEGRKLTQLAQGRRVLEIGSYCGRSTICLARSAQWLIACDYWDGRDTPQPRDTRRAFEQAMQRHGLTEKVQIIYPWTELEREVDLVFIDGAHDQRSVELDIQKACRLLSPDGLVIFHDYSAFDRGVRSAVDCWVDAGAELLETYQTLAIVKPPARILTEV